MKTWTILDMEGNLLHEGQAESKKQFIQGLIDAGKSLSGADLRNLDLSRLDISGADISGADLSGASLRGCLAKETVFDNCKMNGIRAEGMTSPGASFRHASIGIHIRRSQRIKPIFDGAVLTHCRFDAAKIEDASFEGCAAAGLSFCLAQVCRSSFRDARLHNADWTRSRIIRCDFANAEVFATTGANRIPRASLPNRSREAVAVGNVFDGTVLDDTTPAFKRDSVLSRIDNHLAWSASTAAVILAAMHLPLEPSQDWFGQLLGQGTVLVGALTLLNMVKEKATDLVKEHLSDATLNLQITIRTAIFDMVRRGGNIGNAVVAMGKSMAVAPFVDAIRATTDETHSSSALSAFSRMTVGDVDVIVCDKRRMAMVLEWISTSFSRTALIDRDFLVVRAGEPGDAPDMLKFFAGGGMAAIWQRPGETSRVVVWDEEELKPSYTDEDGLTGTSAMHVRRQFERAVIADHLPNTKVEYDPARQQLRAGMDGSIVVTEMRNQLPRNKSGVVLVRPSGEGFTESAARSLIDEADMLVPVRR